MFQRQSPHDFVPNTLPFGQYAWYTRYDDCNGIPRGCCKFSVSSTAKCPVACVYCVSFYSFATHIGFDSLSQCTLNFGHSLIRSQKCYIVSQFYRKSNFSKKILEFAVVEIVSHALIYCNSPLGDLTIFRIDTCTVTGPSHLTIRSEIRTRQLEQLTCPIFQSKC